MNSPQHGIFFQISFHNISSRPFSVITYSAFTNIINAKICFHYNLTVTKCYYVEIATMANTCVCVLIKSIEFLYAGLNFMPFQDRPDVHSELLHHISYESQACEDMKFNSVRYEI